MEVSIPFHLRGKNSGLNEKVQQFNIFYDVAQQDLNKLIEFIQEFPTKQINIEYRNGIDTRSAAALSKISDKVRFRLRAEDIAKTAKLQENGCKFFFDASMACGNWTALYDQIINQHVSEVYLCDDLMYDLTRVRDFCTSHGVKTRIIINRVSWTRPVSDDAYFAPWLRPQDMDELKLYFDTVEFFVADDSKDTHAYDVLYKVYIEKEDWYGDLKELVPDIPYTLPCRGVPQYLVHKRCNCNLACLRRTSCHMCESIVNVANDLRDIGAQLA